MIKLKRDGRRVGLKGTVPGGDAGSNRNKGDSPSSQFATSRQGSRDRRAPDGSGSSSLPPGSGAGAGLRPRTESTPGRNKDDGPRSRRAVPWTALLPGKGRPTV